MEEKTAGGGDAAKQRVGSRILARAEADPGSKISRASRTEE